MEMCLIAIEGLVGGTTEVVKILLESERIRGFGRTIGGLIG